MTQAFLSGNQAFAKGIALVAPEVIAAYPITPQTIVVEELAEMVEEKAFKSDYIHVESEHSALSCCIGASAVGARTFTATSSQGLLYMVECLSYAAGGRFPIVMMNANRATALPWNIYGDQRDSLSQLDCGWLQMYCVDAQEALDMSIISYYIAEHPEVSLPFMVNLDGFHLTHTYEKVTLPSQEDVTRFLPPFQTENKLSFETPKNIAFSVGPQLNDHFKYNEHQAMLKSRAIIAEAEAKYADITGRKYTGLIESYAVDDADYIIITLGSISGLVKAVIDETRALGELKVGLIRIRYMRPFPNAELIVGLKNAKSAAVLEKDISFGNEGTVYTNVNSALKKGGLTIPVTNYIGGLGGRDIAKDDLNQIISNFKTDTQANQTVFIGIDQE